MPRARRIAVLSLVLPLLLAAALASAASLDGMVVRVVDGDTIHVRVGERVEKVRYIGVNTPEVHHPRKGEEPGGREASEVNRALVADRHVRLETDVQARDRYGRLLAYVWIGDTMVNAELVRLGYAQVMTVPPNVRHQRLFLELQREARAADRGLWSSSRGAPHRRASGATAPLDAPPTDRVAAAEPPLEQAWSCPVCP